MSFKFTKGKNDLSKLNGLVNDVKKEFINSAASKMEKLIVDDTIKKGSSPVAGKGRYQVYSDSYKTAIRAGRYDRFSKNVSPVNLTLSGKMLDSFKVSKNKDGLTVEFTDEKAVFHNEKGAGRSKVIRRMLPLGSEGLTPKLMKQVLDLLQGAIDKILAKL